MLNFLYTLALLKLTGNHLEVKNILNKVAIIK